jgi:hypothetical protein
VLRVIESLRPQDSGKPLIRIGGNADGGYLIPDDLDGIEYCFSPGVGTVADFENALANLGIKSFLADYSVESAPLNRPEFTFDKKFLGITNNGQFMTIDSWKDKYLNDYAGDLILQMDIEGFEWQVIANASDKMLDRFRIMVIEFHNLQRLFDLFDFRLFSSCFEKILEHFGVVHIHPNNCSGSVKRGLVEVPRNLEITFLNKRRIERTRPQLAFPHPLDRDNLPDRQPLPLPRCWYLHFGS